MHSYYLVNVLEAIKCTEYIKHTNQIFNINFILKHSHDSIQIIVFDVSNDLNISKIYIMKLKSILETSRSECTHFTYH